MNEKQSWNTSAVFLIMLFGLTAASLLHRQRSFSEKENRSLAARPAVTASAVISGEFESAYETYLTDQFPMRDTWISLRTASERAAGKQEVHDVYFAEDDYLIEKHSQVFTEQQASVNAQLLASFAERMSEKYTAQHLQITVIPNAVDILRDKLPAYAAPYDEEVYLKQIAAMMPEGVWLDSSSILQAHSGEEIYYRTDHHWQTLGAFYVWQAYAAGQGLGEITAADYTVRTVSDTFEGTVAAKTGTEAVPDSIEIYEPVEPVSYTLTYNQSDDIRSTVYQESVLEGRDQYAYFYGGNYGLIQASTNAGTGRRILVLKDSYAHCFVPFLYGAYDQVDMLDLRYFNSSLSEWIEAGEYTDILVLYNAAGFAEDTSLNKLLM